MARLTLRIITPERVILDEAVDSVSVTATDGGMGIFPKHAGMVTALDPGELTYKSSSGEESMFVAGGFAEVRGDTVRVLTAAGEPWSDIDEERAREAETRARERLSVTRAAATQDAVDMARARASLQRALARIRLYGRRSR